MNKKSLLWIGGGVLGLGLIVAMAFAIAGEEPLEESVAFRPVTVTGTPLPPLPENREDQAIGRTAPTAIGEDWDGRPVTIEPNGRPKVVLFLAHWCPFCQQEVPVVQSFVNAGGVPDDVDFIAVSILARRSGVMFPPQDWLAGENWTVPTMADDQSQSVALAYGSNLTPFWMVLDGENTNLLRTSGMIGVNGMQTLFAIAQSSIESASN